MSNPPKPLRSRTGIIVKASDVRLWTTFGNRAPMHLLVEYRFVISLALSAVVGVSGLRVWPFPADNALLGLIHAMQPTMFAALSYAYATVWFSTPFFLFNIVSSVAYIFV